MKNWISRSVGVAAVCLTAASAWAIIVTVDVPLPGVDAQGALSEALGASIPVKANVNIVNGTFRASGRGKVTNLSGAKQTFNNVPIDIPDVNVSSSKYVVKKNGKCTATATGTAALPE